MSNTTPGYLTRSNRLASAQRAVPGRLVPGLFVAGLSVALLGAGTPLLAQPLRVLGADISYWNCGTSTTGISQANWNTAYTTGNRVFVFLRATRGGTTGLDQTAGTPGGGSTQTLSQRYDDPRFVQNLIRATAAGMVLGPYHFGRPDVTGNTGTDEADHFLQMAGAWMRPGYLMPMYDVEAGSALGGNALVQFALDFSDRIYAVMQIRPCIYINGNYSGIFDGATQARRDLLAKPTTYTPSVVGPAYPMLWDARYSDNTNPDAIPVQTGSPKYTYTTVTAFYGPWDDYGDSDPWSFWQYASTVSIPGFNAVDANVDGDVSHGDIEYVRNYLVPAVWWNDSSGDWSTLANWNCGQTPVAPVTPADQATPYATGGLPTARLPGSAGSGPTPGQYDTVMLERPNANITVTLSSGTHNIRKLYMRETLNITGGSLTVNYNPAYRADDSADVLHAGPISAQFSGPVTLSGSGSLNVHTLQVDATRTFTLAGGTLTFNTIKLMPHSTTPAKLLVSGDVNLNALANASATVANGGGSGSSGLMDLGAGSRVLSVSDGTSEIDLSLNVPISNGGLAKAGAGTLRLTAASTYSGGTTVSAGRLLVSNTSGSGTGSGAVTVNSGILGGTGTIAGAVTVNSGGTLAPGTASAMGTITFNSVPTFGGTNYMRIDRNGGAPLADKLVVSSGTLHYGGRLVVVNSGAPLLGGEVFTLFTASAYTGAFTAMDLPALSGGLSWHLGDLAANGTISVISATAPVINSGPDSLTVVAGQNATFTVSAAGGQPFSYQWRFNGANLSGATLSSYTRSGAQPADAGSYSVVVTNTYGSVTSGVATLTVIVPPAITTQPLSQTVAQGTAVAFSVAASGTTPLGYQWRFNGANIGGATATTYSIGSAQLANAGSYSVTVTNASGSAASATAVLTVISLPAITTQPQGQTVVLGETALFSVAATGTAPLAYQWRLNGANIGGATTSSYTRPNVQATDAGSYSVLVTNAYGSVLSSDATLVVDTNVTLPVITSQPQSQTVVAGQSATFTVTATNKASLHYQWRFNGAPISGATGTAYTLANAQTSSAGSYSVVISNIIGSILSADAALTVNFSLASVATAGGTVTRNPDQTSYAPNAVVSLTAAAYSNFVFTGWSGDASGSDNPLSVTLNTNKTITATFVSTATEIVIDNTDPGWSNTSPGGATWSVGSNAAVPKIGDNYLYTAGTGGSSITRSCRWTPTIPFAGFYDVYVYYQMGANRTAGATYKVFYNGGTVSSLQNQYSSTPNLGGWFLVGSNLLFASGTSGYVELGNDAVDTALVSADAAKFVLAAPLVTPAITLQPQPSTQSVNVGQNATFTVSATGTAPLGYQWRFNGTPIPAATASSYTRNNAQPVNAGSYSVVVTNVAGSITSSNAVLIVNEPPAITAQPLAQVLVAGADASFSVTATGTAPLSYQWRFNNSPIADATASTYTRNNAQPADTGTYSVVVTNVAGSATSADAVLTVNVPPQITAQPQGVTAEAGSNITFSVTATGTQPLTYQWRFNGTDLDAATATAYTCLNAQTTNAGTYSVLVSNIAGTATSADAVLTVTQPTPPQIQGISLTPEGQIELQVSAAPGRYAIEGASNLFDWADLANVTNTGAAFQYTDSETNLTQRFYRIRLMP